MGVKYSNTVGGSKMGGEKMGGKMGGVSKMGQYKPASESGVFNNQNAKTETSISHGNGEGAKK